jgi:hypothetical protein
MLYTDMGWDGQHFEGYFESIEDCIEFANREVGYATQHGMEPGKVFDPNLYVIELATGDILMFDPSSKQFGDRHKENSPYGMYGEFGLFPPSS